MEARGDGLEESVQQFVFGSVEIRHQTDVVRTILLGFTGPRQLVAFAARRVAARNQLQ